MSGSLKDCQDTHPLGYVGRQVTYREHNNCTFHPSSGYFTAMAADNFIMINVIDPAAAADREKLLVELVDDAGTAVGTCSVAEAHSAPGRPHRAFSVLLYDSNGRVLLQRRAAVKTRFASRWSNTCCGHPAPGQDIVAAATERLTAEMGLSAELTESGVFTYRAADDVSGHVEHEWDHVLTGMCTEDVPVPDPAEVSEYTWVFPAQLRAAMAANPEVYTPWLPDVLRIATRATH
jgi:isopentenyl-diphosphate delta-isomerase